MQEALANSLAFLTGNTLVYLLALFVGLYIQYRSAAANGRTAAASFWDYWLKETPGMSVATAVAIVWAAGAAMRAPGFGQLAPWDVIQGAFLTGFGFDALIQAPGPLAGLPVASAVDKGAAQIVPAAQKGFSRLSLLPLLAAVGLALALAGCGMFGDAKPVISGAPASCKSVDPQTKAVTVDAVCAEAFDLINQGNVLLIAVDRAVTDRKNSGIWTTEQALPYFQKTGEAGRQLDQAQLLFSSGTYSAAKSKAAATKSLLLLLQKEIAAQAAKSG